MPRRIPGLVRVSAVRREDQVELLRLLSKEYELSQAHIDREVWDLGVQVWLANRRATAA